MATTDRDTKYAPGEVKAYKVYQSTIIPKGCLVGTNSTGYLVLMSDAASLSFVGVSMERIDNSSGASGDKLARVRERGEFQFAHAGAATQAKVGLLVYMVDERTVDDSAAATTNDYPVGVITEYVDASTVRVYVSKHLRVAGTVATGDIANGAVTTAQLGAAAVTAAKLTTTMQKGNIRLDISTLKIIGSNVIGNTTEGLLPDGNTDPSLQRVNSATDKALRVIWGSSSVIEVQFASFAYPDDLDDAATVVVHLLARMAGATDTPVIAVSYFEGVGDTNAGGNTAALSAVIQDLTVTIAASDVGPAPTFATIGLTPGAHTTDALWLYAAYATYTRK